MTTILQRIRARFHTWLIQRHLAFAARQGWLVINRSQMQRALVYLAVEDNKLRRMGGGSASKLRDPRKTLRRLVKRLGTNLAYLTNASPLDPIEAAPKALRHAARIQAAREVPNA